MKVCTKCKQEKPKESYHKLKLGRDGLNPVCTPCRFYAQRERRRAGNDGAKYKYLYGITLNDVKQMTDKQNNKCPICTREFSGSLRKVVDHCHETGKVRGLLCGACNSGIGHLKDDPENVKRALEYLIVGGV